jgi:hypothetical protein
MAHQFNIDPFHSHKIETVSMVSMNPRRPVETVTMVSMNQRRPKQLPFANLFNKKPKTSTLVLFVLLWMAAMQAYLPLSILILVPPYSSDALSSDAPYQVIVGKDGYPSERQFGIKQQPLEKQDAESPADKEKPSPATEPARIDLEHLPVKTTGASANCIKHSLTTSPPHPDQHNLTISCHNLPYRIPQITSSEKIIVGVLSMAGGEGPSRRQSIRETWGKGHSVFFLVAGPWEDIKEEYDEHQDLFWIDEQEVYDGEKSVLTYKTLAFVKIVHQLSKSANLDIQYAFKTDDDSYVQVDSLHKYLFEREHDEYNYWGWCQRKEFKPLRGENAKWAVSYELYPEPMYPRYCQGAGFALSWKFIDRAAGPGNHIADARFMPFEDVAMGLIAQRCGLIPTMVEDRKLYHLHRTDTREERNRVHQGLKKISKSKLPIPDMEGRIVQHRIYDAWDMWEHYKSVLDPEGYKEKTDIKWKRERTCKMMETWAGPVCKTKK